MRSLNPTVSSGVAAKALAAVFVVAQVLWFAGQSPAHADDQGGPAVRGIVRAQAAATVSSELVARVAAIHFKPGQSFRKGDVLLTFDCQRYEADLRAAEAEVKIQSITVETNRQLLRHNATGANDLALAEAKLDQATATAESLRLRTSQCSITAPSDGKLIEKLVDIFEMPQAGRELMKIVKDGELEVDLIVPSSWSVWIKPGYEFPFTIDETGSVHVARLNHLGAVVDPVSRTMKLTAMLLEPGPSVRPGMSGSAQIQAPRS